MGRWSAALLFLSCLAACDARRAGRADPAQERRPAELGEQGSVTLRPQPKPGERVRQPELDGYCADPQRAGAYYYHGGTPVVRVARQDGCAPLYITECESEGRCYPPRDQEPGMWCCADASEHQAAAQAARSR